MIPSRSTAALPPQPLPFFCSRAGGGGFVPGLAFAATGLAAGGFAAAGFGFAGAAGTAGAGLVGGRFGAGAAGGGAITLLSVTRVPPPLAPPTPSSRGSHTNQAHPHPTLTPW